MKAWKQRCNTLLSRDLSTKQLFNRTVKLAGEMGFEYVIYSLEAPLPVSAPRIFVMNNFPPELTTRLQAIRGNKIMPPARHARISGRPFYFPPEHSPEEDAGFWIGLRSLNAVGVTIPAPFRTGTTGCLTLARVSGPLTLAERTTNEARWITLTAEVDAAMRAQVEPELLPEIADVLTEEERMVLALAADGESAKSTARLMNVTERSVNFYRTRAQKKLNAANVTEATVTAAMLGLLTSPADLAGLNSK